MVLMRRMVCTHVVTVCDVGSRTEVASFRIDRQLYKHFVDLCYEAGYATASDCIRALIQEFIQKMLSKKQEGSGGQSEKNTTTSESGTVQEGQRQEAETQSTQQEVVEIKIDTASATTESTSQESRSEQRTSTGMATAQTKSRYRSYKELKEEITKLRAELELYTSYHEVLIPIKSGILPGQIRIVRLSCPGYVAETLKDLLDLDPGTMTRVVKKLLSKAICREL